MSGGIQKLMTRMSDDGSAVKIRRLTSSTLSLPAVLWSNFPSGMLLIAVIWALIASSYCASVRGVGGGGCCGKASSFGNRSSIVQLYQLYNGVGTVRTRRSVASRAMRHLARSSY